MIVVVGINALVAETVDATQSVADLHTAHVVFVGIVEVGVHAGQHVGIHRCDLTQVLCHIETELHAELTHLEDGARVDEQLPTLVLQRTYIGPRQR